VQSSLRANGDVRLADSRLKDLVRLVETFGFYLCSLDVRQESTIHCEVSPASLYATQASPTPLTCASPGGLFSTQGLAASVRPQVAALTVRRVPAMGPWVPAGSGGVCEAADG